MRHYIHFGILLILLCVLSSFFSGGNKDRWPRRWATVDTAVYNRNGEVINVKLDIRYFHKDSVLDLYDFSGVLKTTYKGKKYKIKPYDVEKLEFMLFDKKHTFYSYTDRLKRLYYFFHAENEGDLRLLTRRVNIPKGGPDILNIPVIQGIPQVGLTVGLDFGGEYYAYSLVRSGETYVRDIETGRLSLMLEKYLTNCPELIKKLDNGDFDAKTRNGASNLVQKYHNIIEYYNSTCGNAVQKE